MKLQTYGLIWTATTVFLISSVSLFLNLSLAKSLILASIRTFLQLSFLGIIISWIFNNNNILLSYLMIVVMTFVATHTVSSRIENIKYTEFKLHIFFSLVCGTWIMSFFASKFIIELDSLFSIKTILPFTGLLLGNSLTGVSLGLDEWGRCISDQQKSIETRLAHGATPWESVHPIFKQCIFSSMTPILNSLSIAGIISLPGVLTGQLLVGADPQLAIQYQIVILILIAGSTFIGTTVALLFAFQKAFNSKSQFNPECFLKKFE